MPIVGHRIGTAIGKSTWCPLRKRHGVTVPGLTCYQTPEYILDVNGCVMRSIFAAVLGLVSCLLLSVFPALAQQRIALVIGNGQYANVPVLGNPANDANDVAEALRALGFVVIAGTDLGRNAFTERLKAFGDAISPKDDVLFFYAGHGLQAKGVNYLIPIDAKLNSERDLDFEAVSLDLVLRQMKSARTKIVMLDACRNNPFARTLARSMGTRAVSDNLGLAVTVASDLGTFIAYATQPGNVASDGTGRNSPFTEKLLPHIRTPGQSITDLMMTVRNEVAQATAGAQIPWEHSALGNKFYFAPGQEKVANQADQTKSEAAEAWGWIKNTKNRELLEEFVRRYRDTPFVERARGALASLPQQEQTEGAHIQNVANVSLRPVQPSFDCKEHYKDAEVAVCNNPELAILDNELSRVYASAHGAANTRRKEDILATQRRWITDRDECGIEPGCIARAYRTRIAYLSTGQRSLSAPIARAKPSFDCTEHALPAEVAVCSDADLAKLDVALDAQYVRVARGLSGDRRKALIMEQRQWIATRDTCGGEKRCVSLQYQARLEQLKTRR
ncbi:MAG: caspase family protein [Hyphomicrobiaceae bacterium]